MLRYHITDFNRTACGRSRSHIGAGFDLIGDQGIFAAMHGGNPMNCDRVRTGTADIPAHRIDESCQIDNVWFPCGIPEHGVTVRKGSGQHQIHGGADRHHVKADVCPVEFFAFRDCYTDIVVIKLHSSPHCLKPFQMLINGAFAKIAAAGKRRCSVSCAGKQSP